MDIKPSVGTPTKLAKQLKTNYMFEKGIEFVESAIFLAQKKGQTYVQIHLLLQGLEIILKSILLSKDYDKYNKKLKKEFGHNILKLINELKEIYGFKNIDQKFERELTLIHGYYLSNNLRFGSLLDIFIDVNSIDINTIELKTLKLIKILKIRNHKLTK